MEHSSLVINPHIMSYLQLMLLPFPPKILNLIKAETCTPKAADSLTETASRSIPLVLTTPLFTAVLPCPWQNFCMVKSWNDSDSDFKKRSHSSDRRKHRCRPLNFLVRSEMPGWCWMKNLILFSAGMYNCWSEQFGFTGNTLVKKIPNYSNCINFGKNYPKYQKRPKLFQLHQFLLELSQITIRTIINRREKAQTILIISISGWTIIKAKKKKEKNPNYTRCVKSGCVKVSANILSNANIDLTAH